MKIILSRKGFDSQYGGQPSPILPDGTLLSLPIPQPEDTVKFIDLFYGNKSYSDIVKELKPNNLQINSATSAHLDPDIRYDIYRKRNSNWKAIFGQSGAAQGHLKNQGVTTDDIFLFFGWFRQTELVNGTLKYKTDSPDLHIIYGYLQIGKIFSYGDTYPEYALQHSHCDPRHTALKSNCIYIASDRLSFDNSLPGANTLNLKKNLVLTKPGMTKGRWQLPPFFKELEISYHSPNSFQEDYFKSADKGQEFVIQPNKALTEWVQEILELNVDLTCLRVPIPAQE